MQVYIRCIRQVTGCISSEWFSSESGAGWRGSRCFHLYQPCIFTEMETYVLGGVSTHSLFESYDSYSNCTPSDQLLFYSLSLVLSLFLCWISCEYCVSISLITFKCGLRICLLVCCVIHFLHSCSPAFSGSHPHHLWKQGEKCLMSAFSGATVGYFAPLEVKQRVWMDLQLLLLLYFLLLCFAFSSCSYSVS